jgi:PD-(D/E)XK nuclease superfamily
MKSPLPKGYSPSHILTYRKCEYKFLLAYIYKAPVKTTFQPLLTGSAIHESISKGLFVSEDPYLQRMLIVAHNFLRDMPENPIIETSYEDLNNPGTFKGTIFEYPFLATFDVHWVDERIGADWKASEQKERYYENYEIQAYILNELFKQKYKTNLRKFYFVFLNDGSRYEAQSIYDGTVRRRIENTILNAIEGVNKLEFKKKVSLACEWCEYRGICI